MTNLNIKDLEEKRDRLLYVTQNYITKRINRFIRENSICLSKYKEVGERYSGANAILTGKINSLDFVICSLKKGIKHDVDIWNYELNRALA